MVSYDNIGSLRERGSMIPFSNGIKTTNAKGITPKNENFKTVFFGFFKRND